MVAASICSNISLPPVPPTPNSHKQTTTIRRQPCFNFRPLTSFRVPMRVATAKLSPSPIEADKRKTEAEAEGESMSIDALQRFIDLNLGHWNGFFLQLDPFGNLLHTVGTKLAVSSYGEAELISLIQTLYIRQPPSSTSISGSDNETEWAEYKIKETNMFTVDKYQQIGFFPRERAFALRYQTAGMLETVLRQGVLGEDDTGEESPRVAVDGKGSRNISYNLDFVVKMLPKRPIPLKFLAHKNCLYSLEKDMRARAFHIMDPKGVLEMLLIFLEERGEGTHICSSVDGLMDNANRITPFLGKWKGHSTTKRSGVYGATIAEADSVFCLEYDDNGQLIQDITSTRTDGENVSTNVHWAGKLSNNVITFDGGYQLTLLPGRMYMGCPCDIAISIAESRSFHLELCWLESPGKRQRLVRTFDVEGLAVSSTYILETKL